MVLVFLVFVFVFSFSGFPFCFSLCWFFVIALTFIRIFYKLGNAVFSFPLSLFCFAVFVLVFWDRFVVDLVWFMFRNFFDVVFYVMFQRLRLWVFALRV